MHGAFYAEGVPKIQREIFDIINIYMLENVRVLRGAGSMDKNILTARVPIPEAMLFIPPDGEDRDPDLNNPEDVAAIRKIRAANYIEERDNSSKTWTEESHRLYCPCCYEKGHLSRHTGRKAFDRKITLSSGETAWLHNPDAFQKWPGGPDHDADCDHKDRYQKFTAPRYRANAAAKNSDANVHTITIPTSHIIEMPPRPWPGRHQNPSPSHREVINSSVEPRSVEQSEKAPPLSSAGDIASFITATISSPAKWSEAEIATPEGQTKMADIYFDENESLYHFCVAREEAGQGPAPVIVSLHPNRHPGFWDGWRLPSAHKKFTDENGETRNLISIFEAKTEAAYDRLRDIFASRGDETKGKKVLAYGVASLNKDGNPRIEINRVEQVTEWEQPSPDKMPQLDFENTSLPRAVKSAAFAGPKQPSVAKKPTPAEPPIQYDAHGQGVMEFDV